MTSDVDVNFQFFGIKTEKKLIQREGKRCRKNNNNKNKEKELTQLNSHRVNLHI